jgi:hypothetical protein
MIALPTLFLALSEKGTNLCNQGFISEAPFEGRRGECDGDGTVATIAG